MFLLPLVVVKFIYKKRELRKTKGNYEMQCEDCRSSTGHLCQGDLFLCTKCELKRFPRVASSPVSTAADYQRQRLADSSTIMVNELLCFAQNKMNTLPYDYIVKLCVDSYCDSDIENAKRTLFSVVQTDERMIKRKGMDKSTNNMKDILNLFLSTDPNDIPSFCALDLSKLPPVSYNYVDMSILLKDMENVKHSKDILKSVQAETLCAMQNFRDQTQPGSTNKKALTPHVANANTVQSEILLTENTSAIGGLNKQNHDLKGQSCRSTRISPDPSRSQEKPVTSSSSKDDQYMYSINKEIQVSANKISSALCSTTAESHVNNISDDGELNHSTTALKMVACSEDTNAQDEDLENDKTFAKVARSLQNNDPSVTAFTHKTWSFELKSASTPD